MSPTKQDTTELLLFLGGTAANNHWRDGFINQLTRAGIPAERIYNPVVPDWTPECQAAEDRAKKEARYNLFYIADPKQEGNPVSVYSIAEAIMSLYDRPDNTLVAFDLNGYTPGSHPWKALTKINLDLAARFGPNRVFASPLGARNFLEVALGAYL